MRTYGKPNIRTTDIGQLRKTILYVRGSGEILAVTVSFTVTALKMAHQ